MAISLARFIVYSMDYDVDDADGSKSTLAANTPATSIVSCPNTLLQTHGAQPKCAQQLSLSRSLP
jgi:hypothetical protein